MIQMSIFKIGMRGRRQQLQVESQFLQRVEYMFAPLSLKKLCQNLRIGKLGKKVSMYTFHLVVN